MFIFTFHFLIVPRDSSCIHLPPEGHFFWNNPNFFCDGISDQQLGVCNTTRPLWTGGNYTNFNSSNNLPWFYRQLQNTTTDDIEMRVCRDERFDNEDVAIEAFEFYIQ